MMLTESPCIEQDNLLTGYHDTDALLNEIERSSPVHYQGGYQAGDLSPMSSIGSDPLFGTADKHNERPSEFLIDLDDDFPEATPSNADFLSQLDSQLRASPHEGSKAKGPPSLTSIDKQLQEVGNEAYTLIDLVTELSSIVEEESNPDELRARLRTSLEHTMSAANNILSGLCSANEDLTQFASSQPSAPTLSFRSNPLADPESEEKAKSGMKTLQHEAELVSLRKKIDALTVELKERQRLESREKQRVNELEAQVAALRGEQSLTLIKLQSASEACQMLRSSLDQCADAAVVLASSSTPGEQRDNEESLAIAIEASMRLVDRQAETLALPESRRDEKVSRISSSSLSLSSLVLHSNGTVSLWTNSFFGEYFFWILSFSIESNQWRAWCFSPPAGCKCSHCMDTPGPLFLPSFP